MNNEKNSPSYDADSKKIHCPWFDPSNSERINPHTNS